MKLAMMVSNQTTPSPTMYNIMSQGALPFQYAEDRSSPGVTALAGLGAYLELWQAARVGPAPR